MRHSGGREFLSARLALQQGLDVGDRTPAHLLVDRADDPLLDFLVEALAHHAERFRGSDYGESFEIVAQRATLQLLGSVLDPTIFFLLMEIGFLHRGAKYVAAARRHARG